MRSIAVDRDGTIRPVEIPEPVASAYQAVIRSEAACICNATDTEIAEGRLAAVTRYPALLGHENVGTVVAVGARVTSYKPGDRVVGGLLLQPTDPAYGSGFGGFSDFVIAGLRIVRQAGTVCVYGLIGYRPATFDVRLAPRNWRLAMHQWPVRASEAAAQETLCGWIRAGQLDWWNYIQAQFLVAETAEALTQVRARRVLKALLRL